MSDAGHGGKHPRLAELENWVRDGRVDTIIVAITDMQGRLMGKRVQGEAFLNGVIDHGAHFCTYLLGTDMEMNTPDGFELMSWQTGYGDYTVDPVWAVRSPVGPTDRIRMAAAPSFAARDGPSRRYTTVCP